MDGRPQTQPRAPGAGFRHFFFRGLGIILPTVLTVWILVAAYGFVQYRIAAPINAGVRQLIVYATPFPLVNDAEVRDAEEDLVRAGGDRLRLYREAADRPAWIQREARRVKLDSWWSSYYGMDLVGLVLAVVLIYIIGVVLGSFIGRRLYLRGERLLNRVPLIGRVYPSVKQVTDFLVGGGEDKLKFSRVVAVEYPRKGCWSVGLVTGEPPRAITEHAGEECLTIFVPSAPTPFTGWVIVAPKRDTIELAMTVEDAVKFAVSAGVLIPPGQRPVADTEALPAPLEPVATGR